MRKLMVIIRALTAVQQGWSLVIKFSELTQNREAIEDLTGGVASSIRTENVLYKDKLWAELMQVNDKFLFGCYTRAGRDSESADEDGFVRAHAYTVLAAKEIDASKVNIQPKKGKTKDPDAKPKWVTKDGKVRLLKVHNPWGNQEFNGAFSDGSKEWTSEIMKELNHTFGNDGTFYITFQDFLKFFPVIDRIRLIDPEWTVTQQWTSVNVPLAVEYLDTSFKFTLTKPGPVVFVLSQPDTRYFRGLTGRYMYNLHFRIYKDGEDTYLIRSMEHSGQMRSCNAEVDELEPGTYELLVKVTACRIDDFKTPEEIIKEYKDERREKLLAVGKSFDLTHSKGNLRELEKANRRSNFLNDLDFVRERLAKGREARKKNRDRERLRKKRAFDALEEQRVAKEAKMQEKRKQKEQERREKMEERRKERMDKQSLDKHTQTNGDISQGEETSSTAPKEEIKSKEVTAQDTGTASEEVTTVKKEVESTEVEKPKAVEENEPEQSERRIIEEVPFDVEATALPPSTVVTFQSAKSHIDTDNASDAEDEEEASGKEKLPATLKRSPSTQLVDADELVSVRGQPIPDIPGASQHVPGRRSHGPTGPHGPASPYGPQDPNSPFAPERFAYEERTIQEVPGPRRRGRSSGPYPPPHQYRIPRPGPGEPPFFHPPQQHPDDFSPGSGPPSRPPSPMSSVCDDDFPWDNNMDGPVTPEMYSDSELSADDVYVKDPWQATCVIGLRVCCLDENAKIEVCKGVTRDRRRRGEIAMGRARSPA
jgi:Calpain family cysteine protease